MTDKEFENLILRPESTTLDFKKDQYTFLDDQNTKKSAEFIKDIISFANTIRKDSGYIILGVKSHDDGKKDLIGVSSHLDDASLQEKIKSTVYPIPKFSYYPFFYKSLPFGIIEIPVHKYELPISPITKLKGLEPGKIYFRRGSSNSEASGYESITIAKWMESLPAHKNDPKTTTDEISHFIKQFANPSIRLSEGLSNLLAFAIKHSKSELKQFCINELSGWEIGKTYDTQNEKLDYRTIKILVTPLTIEISPFYLNNTAYVLQELKKLEGVIETKIIISHSISKLEDILNKFSLKGTQMATLPISSFTFSGNEKQKDIDYTAYITKDNIEHVYNNIREKVLTHLVMLT